MGCDGAGMLIYSIELCMFCVRVCVCVYVHAVGCDGASVLIYSIDLWKCVCVYLGVCTCGGLRWSVYART